MIFTSQLAPALIFGVLLGKYSHHNMATVETLIGSAVAYISSWDSPAPSPSSSASCSTGPSGRRQQLGHRRLKLPFFVFYEWTGIWTALFLFLLVAFNRVDIVPIAVRN